MNVSASSRTGDNRPVSSTANTKETKKYENTKQEAAAKERSEQVADTDTLERSVSEPQNESGGFQMKSSSPDNSVGQLAAELARAETKIDVQQVLSKATRALASLKMSAYASQGDDAKKALQMIKRMEKLIKKIQKKLKNLSKEEQLENQQKKAEKQQEAEKAKQIREELRTRRKRRHREEREYALKEMGEDNKNAANEMLTSVSAAMGASTADLSSVYNSTGIDLSTAGASLDITI